MLTKEISGGILGYEDVSTPHHRVLTKPKPMKSEVDMDKLDERKLKILQAIIRNYLETGEPVGSRTISKYTDLNLSSATIRNEMSDLEELGYIVQPHTSAGRIPSDKGYRLYVDTMMSDKIQEVEDMKEVLLEKADKMETLLKQVAKLLAVNTNYATMVTSPQYRSRKVKFIQLTGVDEEQLLAIIVIEGNIVKNKMIDLRDPVSAEIILKMNLILNTFLQGLDPSEINLQIIKKIRDQVGGYFDLISDILDEITQAINEEEDIQTYMSGTSNIFKYPELGDMQKASELLYALEDKKELSEFIAGTTGVADEAGIQVYIGTETPMEAMRDCSVVTATYQIEEGVFGKVGIIGPKRMDYEKVVGTLQTLITQLDDIFKKKT